MEKRIDYRHPMLQRDYAIWTPPSHEMIKKIGDWIDQGVSGGHIYGPSRFGKTKTVKWYLKTELESRFKRNLPLVVWIRRDGVFTEAEFWNTSLVASKYEFFDPMRPKPKVAAKFLFEQQLYTLAKSARDNYVLFLIDEAQEMTLKEWKQLLGLQNTLDYQGIRLCVISIGSYSLHYQPDYLARTGNPHIAARFFACDTRFRGITSIKELGFVLEGYDIYSKWPKENGVSYLQYFAPDAFEAGHRLKENDAIMWSAFEQLLPPKRKNEPSIEIPMLHISYTIEKALRRLGEGEDWEKVTCFSSWLEIIASTGFIDHMRNIS